MDEIQGYRLTRELSAQDAGFSRWGFGEKAGREYYIKEFLSPVYPVDSGELSEKLLVKKRKSCEDFYRKKKTFYDTLRSCRTGNIITIEDFFRHENRYYIITDKVAEKKLTNRQLASLPDKKKLILIRSLLYSFSALHGAGIVHADVKPENILLKSTADNGITGKIVDFDSGFLKNDPPSPQELQGDFLYLAPEAFLFIDGETVTVDGKIDVFALGILFHLYWTGELPAIPKERHYVFEAVLNGEPVGISEKIPDPLRSLIVRMLKESPTDRPSAAEALQILSGKVPKPTPKSNPPEGGRSGFYVPDDLD